MKHLLKNERGQSTTELVLYAFLIVGVMGIVSKTIREAGLLKSMVGGPWQHISGMVENGVWAPPEAGAELHPSTLSRHSSPGDFNVTE